MLYELGIENFRCFKKHIIPFKSLTVMVGKNNAGKSTIIEALRILSIVIHKYKRSIYYQVPEWLTLPLITKGISPSLDAIELDDRNMFHRYGDAPAIITASFTNNCRIIIYLGKGKIFAQIFDKEGNQITSKYEAQDIDIIPIYVLPHIVPLLENEKKLTYHNSVISYLYSRLSYRHFRELVCYFKENYNEVYKRFCKKVEETWNGVRVNDVYFGEDEIYHLFIRDGDFVTDVSCLGHGLQMWIQTLFFATHVSSTDCIVFDEPDVFLHADLQRKLIRILRNNYKQIIIATHSVEIIEEVDSNHILVIDRKEENSFFTDSIPQVQVIIRSIGSMYNIALTRIIDSRRVIIVEGDDMDILRRIHSKLYPYANQPLEHVPNLSSNGWGGWEYRLFEVSELINQTKHKIDAFFIFDRDFYPDFEIDKRMEQARKHNVNITIWTKKELENYLLVPSVIERIVKSDCRYCDKDIYEQIKIIFEKIATEFYEYIIDKHTDMTCRYKKGVEPSTIRREVRRIIDEKWKTIDGMISVVPGKEFLSRLSENCKSEFDVSFGTSTIISNMTPEEIDPEIIVLLKNIEKIVDDVD